MRFLTLALGVLMSAAPLAAQAVDPKDIAAIQTAGLGWDLAYGIAADADPVTTDVLTWMRLREGAGTFTEYQQFMNTHPDWPALDRLRAESEQAIQKSHDPAEVIAWFAQTPPQTGEGAVRLAEALMQSGRPNDARNALRTAWLELRLTNDGQKAMMTAFSDVLEPFHLARTDAMLWRSRRTDAARMLPLLARDQRALAAARIGYSRNLRNMTRLYNAVPAALRQDAGLAYDRYNWLAGRGSREDAVKILLDRSTSRSALGEPFRWSGWRRSLARWEMRQGRAEQAYRLASRHYLTEGAAFADLEWLSGYISLTYLENPSQALAHFEKAARVVGTPISLGRMHYWIGRAQDVLGAPELATLAYTVAATHQTGFYGLLAAERLGLPLDPLFSHDVREWHDTSVLDADLTKAAFMLLAAGERGHAVTFFAALGKSLGPADLTLVGGYLDEMDEQYYTLLLGKTAASQGVVVPQIYFPLHDLADMDLPVDSALALSIARRESEFNVGIGSPVGALGLMQLMPATAEEVAGFMFLPYSKSRLTSDWEYNAALGARYLSILHRDFGNTPVMIAAGYNAGPSRPKVWVDERGDPRLGEMDVIDWIEHIPFRETRNYVMRVTESIPIYQARLTGQTGPVEFAKLLIGAKPLLRPRARPLPQVVGDEPSIRPMMRPERG